MNEKKSVGARPDTVAEKPAASKMKRRTFVKGLALGTALAGAPAIRNGLLASSGELNVIIWSDYLQDGFVNQFKKDTGITLNITGIGSNDELINKIKATKGRGFDIAAPTNNQGPRWKALNVLQTIDVSKIDLKHVNKAFLDGVTFGVWAIGKQDEAYWLPQVWGTEAIAWNTEKWRPKSGVPSFGDVWSEENRGLAMARAESLFDGVIQYMEGTGEFDEGDWLKTYSDETMMKKVFDKATAFIVKNKKSLKKFWNDADGQKLGFLQEGVVIGQCWDGPTLALKSEGKPFTYQAPKEGAFSWCDGLVVPKAARNRDEIYEFFNYQFQVANAANQIGPTGYNSAVNGAETLLDDTYKKNFSEAYPGDSLDKLNPWPPKPVWYAQAKSEYEQKVLSA